MTSDSDFGGWMIDHIHQGEPAALRGRERVMGVIEWLPIAEAPEALKDGRDVLAWCTDAAPHVVHWVKYEDEDEDEDECGWRDEEGLEYHPTHFAEINPPA